MWVIDNDVEASGCGAVDIFILDWVLERAFLI